jgi:16S rRNA (uracil1498-N3)-methyltransferase
MEYSSGNRMHLFFVKNIVSDFFSLDIEQSKHCKVLRLKAGDIIYLTEGKGSLFKATIVDDNYKAVAVKILETFHEYNKRPFYLHIAIAPTKSPDRFEWFVEKATEIGVDEITPLLCERSEKTRVKTERLQKIAESAMKQSVSAYLPKINEAVSFAKLISNSESSQKFIAYCNDSDRLLLQSQCTPEKSVLILIGPEGDFTENEIGLSQKNDFIPISLGNSRLRTETAGVVACTIINMINS